MSRPSLHQIGVCHGLPKVQALVKQFYKILTLRRGLNKKPSTLYMFSWKCHEILRKFCEFNAAKMPIKLVPKYSYDERSQNMKMSFKFSPNIFSHKELLYKLTLEWNFLSNSEMDQTGNPSWSIFQIQKILNIQQQRFLRTTGKPWDHILVSPLPNKLDFSTLLQTL